MPQVKHMNSLIRSQECMTARGYAILRCYQILVIHIAQAEAVIEISGIIWSVQKSAVTRKQPSNNADQVRFH